MAKKLVSINLDEELIDEIDEVAKKLGISRSAMVNLAMRGIVMGETSNMIGELLAAVAKPKKRTRRAKAAIV